MRKLGYFIDVEHLMRIRADIVPALFTSHQFDLIMKRFSDKKLSLTEKNEFSRVISKKMKAINTLIGKPIDLFIYGEEKMISTRVIEAKKILKQYSRKFKGKHLIISGSFLYKEDYNDIDIFVISKYNKDDFKKGDNHINYLTEDVYNSIFFKSLKKLCISTKEIPNYQVIENITFDTFISLYQETLSDMSRTADQRLQRAVLEHAQKSQVYPNLKHEGLHQFAISDISKNHEGLKLTLREFLIQSEYLSKTEISDSKELNEKVSKILLLKKPELIVNKILINTIALGMNNKEAINSMNNMIKQYESISKEYPKHKDYYTSIINVFKEVIDIES